MRTIPGNLFKKKYSAIISESYNIFKGGHDMSLFQRHGLLTSALIALLFFGLSTVSAAKEKEPSFKEKVASGRKSLPDLFIGIRFERINLL